MKKVLIGVFMITLMLSGVAMAKGPINQDQILLALSAEEPAAPAAAPAEPKHKKIDLSGVGGYGGPMGTYIWMDMSPLAPMTKDRGLDAFPNGLGFIGGSGGMIKNNVFIGGFGFAGNLQTSGELKTGDDGNAEFSMGGGGLIIELNSGKGPAGVVLGAMLGAGGIFLEADGDDLGPDESWDASSGVGLVYPYAGFWFAPTEWMFVQLDGGYMFFELDATGGSYWSDAGNDMVDGQLLGGAMINLKVNFGTMGK